MHDHDDASHDPASAEAPAEPSLTYWEKRVDAMDRLICERARRHFTTEDHRRAVEALPPEDYARLSHYERWVLALQQIVVERGLLGKEEIAARVAEIEARPAPER